MTIGHGFLRLAEAGSFLPPLATVLVVARLCLSRLHLPASLCSTAITPLLRYYEGSVSFGARFFEPLAMNAAPCPQS
jgi:hypothetical protein